MRKRKDLPKRNEVVLCTIKRITPYAAWCDLDEFTDLEGMIHVSEVVGKWVHDIREYVKQNKQYPAKVTRIDEEKGHINLSLKRVSKSEQKEKMNVVKMSQRAEKILEQIGGQVGKNLDQTYEEVGNLLEEKFGELFVAFEEIRKKKDELEKLKLSKMWNDAIVTVIEKSFKEKQIILKVELEIKSYAGDGVNKIKTAIGDLEKKGFNVKYISAPLFKIEMKTTDPKAGEKKMKEALENLVENEKKIQGEVVYRFIR